jgi:hypothetical protein
MITLPVHWFDKFKLSRRELTVDLVHALKEYEEVDGYYLVDTVVDTDKIFAFRINHLLPFGIVSSDSITDGYLNVVYITADFELLSARISRFSDENGYDWDVTQEIAKYLGLSMDEWKKEGCIEEIVGKIEQKTG